MVWAHFSGVLLKRQTHWLCLPVHHWLQLSRTPLLHNDSQQPSDSWKCRRSVLKYESPVSCRGKSSHCCSRVKSLLISVSARSNLLPGLDFDKGHMTCPPRSLPHQAELRKVIHATFFVFMVKLKDDLQNTAAQLSQQIFWIVAVWKERVWIIRLMAAAPVSGLTQRSCHRIYSGD